MTRIPLQREGISIWTLACLCLCFSSACAFAQTTRPELGFALHDGETVVFYGDSITAQRLYTRFVEDFVLTRYPDLHLKFVNAGVPGDQVSGGYAGKMNERVQRDVQPFHPGMITVMLGMNDGWWGTESPQVDEFFKKGYEDLLTTLQKVAPTAALTLIRPSPYDEITHDTEFPLYSRVIDDLANDVTKIAAERQASRDGKVFLADFHQPLIDALKRAKVQSPAIAALIVPDRIHPSETGHWIMAAELLRTWHINPIVSSLTIHAGNTSVPPSVIERQRTTINRLARTSTGLQWTQQDDDLPLPFDFNNALIELLPSISQVGDLDQQMVKAQGLDAGSYDLMIDGKVRATFSSTELNTGVNLALIKTPMVDQARDIDYIQTQRMQLDQARFVLSADVKEGGAYWIAENKLRQAEDQLTTEIRKQLQPKPHTFELRKK
jgi:lysophospholipase L1-like esterase